MKMFKIWKHAYVKPNYNITLLDSESWPTNLWKENNQKHTFDIFFKVG